MGDDTPTCPTCGEEFETERGKNIHHHHVHGESIAFHEFECETCGSRFEAYDKDRKYCSPECNTHNTTSCDFCGTEFEVQPNQERRTERNFCSMECKSQWQSEARRGDNHPRHTERVSLSCTQCGDEFEKLESKLTDSENNFCSMECYGAWKATGLPDSYGEGWYRKRRMARERDNHRCQICGATSEERGREPDVHHIRPVHSFDDPTDAHTLSNLICLCPHHHNKWEGIPLRPEVSPESE